MGGGGGHGHGPPYKIPDHRMYKVEDVPELMAVKRQLAQKGLKDPWLRNEVWRYRMSSTPDILRQTVGRGMKWGFIAAVITTGVGYMIDDGDHGRKNGLGAQSGGHGGHH